MGLIKESEIFNEYLKLAEKEGLVTEEDYANVKIAADEASNIEALYGLRMENEPKDSIYSPLLDKAHPDTAVAGLAHDRMNGVVENLKQRQSIMAGIALKTPDGGLIQRRYVKAYTDLMNNLVRVGFTMDHEDYPELMKVADDCAGELEKKAETIKQAQWFTAAAILIGSVLASAYAINHTPASRQNVVQNCELVLEAAKEIPHSSIYQDMTGKVGHLKDLAQSIQPIRTEIGSATDAVKAAAIHKEDFDTLSKYMNSLKSVLDSIPKWINVLKTEPDYEEASADWWEKIKDVVHEFTGSSKTDVITNLEGLDNEIKTEFMALTKMINGVKGNIIPKAQAALKTDQQLRENVSNTMDSLSQKDQENSGYAGIMSGLMGAANLPGSHE